MKPFEEYSGEDKLRKYFSSTSIEPAPSDFTSLLMRKIKVESVTEKVKVVPQTLSMIPFISAGVALTLVVLAYLFPGGNSLTVKLFNTGILKAVEFTSANTHFFQSLSKNLPEWTVYLCAGLFLLLVFDRILFNLFYRKTGL